MRERAKIGKGSNRLNYIPQIQRDKLPEGLGIHLMTREDPRAILYAINQGDHVVAFHLHIERSKYDVPKNSRL
jgi:hypothetical protein